MPAMTIDDFDAFFAEVHGGEKPYPWQRELVRDLAAGRWPDQLVAPTGTGKSALVEALVFVRALSISTGRSFPRRFVMVVPRRALVDSQSVQAERVAEALRTANGGVLSVARDLLRVDGAEPLNVSVLRGGTALDSTWLDDPLGCQILCATPEMLGSRVLFRGFLASAQARPRHAGLLAYDTVAIVDESHLNRQLVTTLRRVGELAGRSPLAEQVPPLRVIETTATPSDTRDARITVHEASGDSRLEKRLTAGKELQLRRLENWPIPRAGKQRTEAVELLAELARGLRGESAGTIGVIVNRVQDALDIADVLRAKEGMRVRVLVGPMRPHDRAQLEREHPHLLDPEGDDRVDVLVATQTVEVGVDLDLHGLVTEVASASALVQRMGRVNRRGLLPSSRVIVVLPEADALQGTSGSNRPEQFLPYRLQEIEAALAWLSSLGDGGDLSPAALADSSIPSAIERRLLYSRVEPAEAALLSRTSETLFAEPQLDLWLRDDLDPEQPEVSVVGRTLPEDLDAARELLGVVPPQPHELYPTRLGNARALAGRADGQAHLWRGGEVQESGQPQEIAEVLRPGDVLVLESSVPGALYGVIAGPRIAVKRLDPLGDVLAEAGAVDHPAHGRVQRRGPQRVILRDDLIAHHAAATMGEDLPAELLLLDHLPDAVREATLELQRKRAENQDAATPRSGGEPETWLDSGMLTFEDIGARLPAAAATCWRRLFGDGGRPAGEFSLPAAPDAEDHYSWLVISDQSTPSLTPDQMQERSRAGRVRLDDHQRDVAVRAEQLGRGLRLPDELVDVLRVAGEHHDDGKIAAPWQSARLGNRGLEVPLAKAPLQGGRARRRQSGTSLPIGWRHEQLSVALAWPDLPAGQRALAARLIGTSHGHGRMAFPHGSAELVPCDQAAALDAAQELFDEGLWDEAIDSTDRHWGVWGAAFLEAILRAADVQVSKEGH